VGSTFGFRLQLEVEKAPPEAEPVTAPRALRVLIADPSPTSGAALAKLLQEGNAVELAGDAPSARMQLMQSAKSQRPFDLVLADLRLGSAFEALEVIGVERLGVPPMIVMAPVNLLPSAANSKWPGRKVALAKPVKRNDLLWCIAEVLRGPVPSSVADEKPSAPAATSSRDMCVLVAEDHPVNQRITTRFLEKLGIAWEVAGNGEEAFQAVKKRAFDMILMDVQMPVMDGLEATLAIRKYESLRGSHVPIVALTANVLEEHRREAQQAGFDDYLAKPVNLEELRAKIQKWTSERAAVAA
jgi:CheY-like chemotaxis protein